MDTVVIILPMRNVLTKMTYKGQRHFVIQLIEVDGRVTAGVAAVHSAGSVSSEISKLQMLSTFHCLRIYK